MFNASIRSNGDKITEESLVYFGAVKKRAGNIILIDKSDEAMLIIIRLHKIYHSKVSPAIEQDEIRLIPSKTAVPGYRYICLVVENGTEKNL
ncbi:MAG: hypothetical protein PQJ50_10435 [Spirochaetales bacterium]|nr:hypothetical protein [Spirochaetales bacterium]